MPHEQKRQRACSSGSERSASASALQGGFANSFHKLKSTCARTTFADDLNSDQPEIDTRNQVARAAVVEIVNQA